MINRDLSRLNEEWSPGRAESVYSPPPAPTPPAAEPGEMSREAFEAMLDASLDDHVAAVTRNPERLLAHDAALRAREGGVMSKTPVFWSCLDPEQLSLESPEEAIVEIMDGEDSPAAGIAKRCPLTVKGYAPDEIDMDWVASLAERAVEMFDETIQDNYGDPDGDSLIEKNKPALTSAIEAAFRAAMQGVTAWSCSVVETREYTAEQVEAILRAECPEWFPFPGE